MNRIGTSICLLVLASLSGCSAFAPPDLTGRWTARELSIQFENDGRVTVVTRNGVARGIYTIDSEQSPPQLVVKTRNESSGTESLAVYGAEFVGHKFLQLKEQQSFADGERVTRRREAVHLLERAEVLADGATLPASSAESQSVDRAVR